MSLFGEAAKAAATLERQEDTLGGGGFQVLDSGLYPAKIKVAYLTEASSGAKGIVIQYLLEDGTEYNETQYVTSGTAKGGNPYWVNDKGDKIPLPGFTRMDDIALLTTEVPLFEQAHELKTLKIWDSESCKEIPREVPVFVDMMNKEVILAIQKVRENKTEKDGKGAYQPTNEERVFNEVVASFHADTKQTVNEAMNNREADFIVKWEEKNKGQLRDKYKAVTGSTSSFSSSSTGSATPRTSMFAKK